MGVGEEIHLMKQTNGRGGGRVAARLVWLLIDDLPLAAIDLSRPFSAGGRADHATAASGWDTADAEINPFTALRTS